MNECASFDINFKNILPQIVNMSIVVYVLF